MELTLGKRIGMYRRQKNLTQEDLAGALGVTPQAVSKWENDGACPDITLLPKLAKLLGVSVDTLLSGEEPQGIRMLPPEQRKELKDMMLRIVVDSADGDRVRVNLPMALVELAVNTGLELPQISGLKGAKIDLQQVLELVRQGVMGDLVEVDSADGDKVRIFVE